MKQNVIVVYYLTEETELWEISILSTKGEKLKKGRVHIWYNGDVPVYEMEFNGDLLECRDMNYLGYKVEPREPSNLVRFLKEVMPEDFPKYNVIAITEV